MNDFEPRNQCFKSIFITHTSPYGGVLGTFLLGALPCWEAEKGPHRGPQHWPAAQ